MHLGLPFFLEEDKCVSHLVLGTTEDCSTTHLSRREILCEGILACSEAARGHQGGILSRRVKQKVPDGPKVSAMEFVCKCTVRACPTQKSLTCPIEGDPMIPHQSGRNNRTRQLGHSVFHSNTVPIDFPSEECSSSPLSRRIALFVRVLVTFPFAYQRRTCTSCVPRPSGARSSRCEDSSSFVCSVSTVATFLSVQIGLVVLLRKVHEQPSVCMTRPQNTWGWWW